ncbi:hypothetical protein MHYP_G00011230 [Metynnis hypsauchen]
MNRTVKERLTKAMMETGKKWLDLLPAILCEIRMTPSATTKLSPFEVIFGKPFTPPWVRDKPTHSFVPGDTVLVKTLNPQKVGEAAYGPPTTVITVTRTAVLTTSSPQWIHASQLKKSPIPEMPKTKD